MKVENINRVWVDNDSGIFVRPWTKDEYDNLDPKDHIFEKYWSYYCPICGFIPHPTIQEIAIQQQESHVNHFACKENKERHKGVIEYRNHELKCFETREEFNEEFDCWVSVQGYYN